MNASRIKNDLIDLLTDLNLKLPDSYTELLKKEFSDSNESPDLLVKLLENSQKASEKGIPLCQDCGTVTVFAYKGVALTLEKPLEQVINSAVKHVYTEMGFRKSMVESPVDRKNTGDNTPALVTFIETEGSSLEIDVLLKGGGSENISFARMISPGSSENEIVDMIIENLKDGVANSCPPLIIGIGMGGSLDKAALLAKKALFRQFGTPSVKNRLSNIEEKVKNRLNNLGVGPFGMAGKLCALAVHAEDMSCHIASFPIAVNVLCHAARIGRLRYD